MRKRAVQFHNSHEQLTAQIERGDVRLLEQIAEPWLDLCRCGPTDAPFYRPEWIAAHLRAFAPGKVLQLVTGRAGDRLCGVLPLIHEKGFFCGLPARILHGAANVHSCRFDLLRAPGRDGGLIVKTMWESLKNFHQWDVIELPHVPEGGAGEQLLQFAREDGFLTGQCESDRSPYMTLDGQSSPSPQNSHFRQNLQRRWRKAQARWPVRLRLIDHADPAELQRFYDLESSGWKGKSKTAIACSQETRTFYDAIAAAAAHFGYFSLYLLEFGETVVAGHFGLSCGGHYYSPKVAYHESYAGYGPGHLIVDAILKDLSRRGIREFDFLGPWMEWKGEWAREVHCHSSCYIFRPGAYGRLLYATKMQLMTTLRRIARSPLLTRLRSGLRS